MTDATHDEEADDLQLGALDASLPLAALLQRTAIDKTFQSAVAFRGDRASRERRNFVTTPQTLFRGEGLWLWGADETTLVHHIQSGMQNCFKVSDVPLPGLYFEAGLSFAEFERLLEKAPNGWRHERLKALPPIREHQRIRMLATEIGNSLTLDISGPLTHAVMWGKTIR